MNILTPARPSRQHPVATSTNWRTLCRTSTSARIRIRPTFSRAHTPTAPPSVPMAARPAYLARLQFRLKLRLKRREKAGIQNQGATGTRPKVLRSNGRGRPEPLTTSSLQILLAAISAMSLSTRRLGVPPVLPTRLPTRTQHMELRRTTRATHMGPHRAPVRTRAIIKVRIPPVP
jgi:hypothetical protein